ncbi:tRNA-(ms[2]io[6]A)-hydroxylase [uncultured Flavobacterium sp.]|uniref:tRNA-(ms[2]io[6]A)-hydroxylase n=1 Tax=uncultured Flavobacterium sp. TaxID=165435 RepID=UPI0030EB2583
MFKLKLPTDPRWARIAESNIEEVLTDHAWCEQKAASNCISLITMLPEHTHIITELIKIAQEEMEHFEQVHELIKSNGWVLGRERKDHYVNELYQFMLKGGSRQTHLVERLLFSAMIEARSCERFKVLSDTIDDKEMAKFYRDLMVSEANHYTIFINFANEIGEGMDVKKRWEEWLAYEAKIIESYGNSEAIHG